jgi:hypothetical protein
MNRRHFGAVAVALVLSSGSARADDANAIVERAVKAMGGREQLEKVHGVEAKSKGTLSIGGNDSPLTAHAVGQGLDHYRLEFEVELGGNKVKGMTVVNGNKGWRKFGDEMTEFDDRSLRAEKRMIYLQQVAGNPTLLSRQGFKVVKAGDATITATGPDGKEFTIHFDKKTGLPAKLEATVVGFTGDDVKQETTYSDFKDFGGIKKSTKSESKRDGEPYLKQELVEFKLLDKVDPKTFDEPK